MNEQERQHAIDEAELGTRGQGQLVRCMFDLRDTIARLDESSTRLNRRMYFLSIVGTVVAVLTFIDMAMKYWPKPVVFPATPKSAPEETIRPHQ